MAQRTREPNDEADRIRSTVRTLKEHRRLTDAEIARVGGFTSRQIVNYRIAGTYPLDVEDIVRLAAALGVRPHVLFLDKADAIRWLEDHPDYKPPRFRRQKRRPGGFRGTRRGEQKAAS